MPIDLSKYPEFHSRVGASASRPPLVPVLFADAESHAFETRRKTAVVALNAGTKLLDSTHQQVAGGQASGDAAKALGREAEKTVQSLPLEGRGYVETLRPVTEAVVTPLEEQRRQAGLVEITGALTQQKAVLRQLARIGAPLSALFGVAKGQLDQLHGAGLMAGEREPLEQSWQEELAANRLLGRLDRLGDAPLGEQPEAPYLAPETLLHLEGLQRQQRAARQEALLGSVLEGAVGGLAAGQAPTQDQAAALEPALPGVSQAATAEAAGWQGKQDAILALLKNKPILQRLKDMAGGGGLYRRLLVEEQRRVGVPEEQLKVWDRGESDAAVAGVLSLPAEDAPPAQRAQALLDYARQQLGGLPPELQPVALAELRRRGLTPEDALALGDITSALAGDRDIAALRRARLWARDAGRRAPGEARPAPDRNIEESPGGDQPSVGNLPVSIPPVPSAAEASVTQERLALIQRLEQTTPDQREQIEAEIQRLFPGDPAMQERLRTLAGEAAQLLGNPGVDEGLKESWQSRRDALAGEMGDYISPEEGTQEGARALAGQAAGLERKRQLYVTWPAFEDANGHPNSDVRIDPESGDAVLWDREQDRPVTNAAGQVVRLDRATLERLEDQGLAGLQTAWEIEAKLTQAAQGKTDLSPEEIQALRDQLEVATPYLKYLRQQGEGVLDRISHGDRSWETQNLLQHFTELLADPTLFAKQQDIVTFYDRNGGDKEAIYQQVKAAGELAEHAHTELARAAADLEQLEAQPPNPSSLSGRTRAENAKRAELRLLKAADDYAKAMQALAELGPLPDQNLDSFLGDRAAEDKSKSALLWGLAGFVATGGVGEWLGFVAGTIFGAAWAGSAAIQEATQAGLEQVFAALGIDGQDPTAVAKFARENTALFAKVHEVALIKGLIAAGKSAVAARLAEMLFGDMPVIEDLAAWGIEKLIGEIESGSDQPDQVQ